MLEDINLKEFPRASGVYKIIWNGAVIYVGSSNNLYNRMTKHITYIRKGSKDGHKKGFYLFLQNNHFSVEFELTENYRKLEQELIEYFEPIYNERSSFTGCGKRKGREAEYRNQYNNQKCLYNGEILKLSALATRFARQGIKHSTQESKKYLIEEKEFHIL